MRFLNPLDEHVETPLRLGLRCMPSSEYVCLQPAFLSTQKNPSEPFDSFEP